jgi:hypothetical protein
VAAVNRALFSDACVAQIDIMQNATSEPFPRWNPSGQSGRRDVLRVDIAHLGAGLEPATHKPHQICSVEVNQ